MPPNNDDDSRSLPLNTHVRVIAGEHDGEIGYVSDTTKATAQITTGDDEIFTVRKTSLRILAPAVVVPNEMVIPTVQLPRIMQRIDHIDNILTLSGPGNTSITLGQWQEISAMITDMFE